jgi:3D (Asp-Asp-Asp) domain-containing protein
MALSLAFFISWSTMWAAAVPDCAPRTMRVTFYTCGEGFSHCLTKKGNQPIPFRTVAVGDRKLLGRWLYVEDLGGWVHASDTGGGLGRNALDVFIGESRMARHARRLGVQFWEVRLCRPVKDVAQPMVSEVADPQAPSETATTTLLSAR